MLSGNEILALGRLLWSGGRMVLPEGMKVVDPGVYDAADGNFTDAEVQAGTAVYRGTVAFSDGGEYVPSLIMRVTSRADAAPRTEKEARALGVTFVPGNEEMEWYRKMRAGREMCGDCIAAMDPARRVHLFSRFFDERTDRKCRQLLEIWEEGERDWNYALYVGLFMGMGGSDFKHLYMDVARRVPYKAIAHEKASREAVETMLLGASGLLQIRSEDRLIVKMKKDFEYFHGKYGIEPMAPGLWLTDKPSAYVSPVLRLVQMAGFLATREFIFDGVCACRTPQDVYNLFRAEVSDYWIEQFSFPGQGPVSSIGKNKMDSMAINMVVPLMVSYASVTGNTEMADAAQELIWMIGPEMNRKTKPWKAAGVGMENAADSQAVLELNNEYCLKAKCPACPVGLKMIKNLNHGHTVEFN